MRTVILGAGYAGATCAHLLDDKIDELVWVSEDDYHFVVHEAHRLVREPSLEGTLRIPVDEIASCDFVEARVESVEFDERVVETDAGTVPYDRLVVAFGQRTADYGIDGVRQHGLTLKSLDDARAIRATAERVPDGGRVVVAGGGLSGIQVAGELAEMFDARAKSPSVVVVEALDRVMPEADEDLRAAIERKMRKKGIVTRTGDAVVEATTDEVHFESGETLAHDALVWTAGLAPQDVETRPPPENGRRGAFAVEPTLRVKGHERVFAVGDAAYVVDVEGNEAPPTAWAARQQGSLVAENVVRASRAKPLKEYRMRNPGTLVSVGDATVGKVAGQVIEGVPARVLKRGAAVRHIAQTSGAERGVKSVLADL
ncbi:MAG: FAD-dependent oxidoreductase [Halobacteriales archaeon]|nr:FAD-dependent oxidoreductase [Halobacteriales archaeon]